MSTTVLSDVVACVVCCTAQGSLDDKQALTRKLESLGASVKSRFGKGVTHVVYRRNPSPSPEQKQLDDEELRGLYAKAEKATLSGGIFAVFVDPFWIEACASRQQKAPEDKYLISCPLSPVFDLSKALTPGSTARKKRKRRMQQPKPAGAYELDMSALDFSSTQQMMDDGNAQGFQGDGTYPGSADAADKKVRWSLEGGPACRPGSAPSTVQPQALLEESRTAKASPNEVDTLEAAEILLGLPAGIARSDEHATPSGRFVTPQPVVKGRRGWPGSAKPQQGPRGSSATPDTNSTPGSSGRRATARKTSAASARATRGAQAPSSAGPVRRRRSAKGDDSTLDGIGTVGGGEDVSGTAARPRSAPVRASARAGLRPTRMRPRSPSPAPSTALPTSPQPARTSRHGPNKRIKLASNAPEHLENQDRDALQRGDALADEGIPTARTEALPSGLGVSVPVQDAPASWQPPAQWTGLTETLDAQPQQIVLLGDQKPPAQPCERGPVNCNAGRSTGNASADARPAAAHQGAWSSQQHDEFGAAAIAKAAGSEEHPGTAAEPASREQEKPAQHQQTQLSIKVSHSLQSGSKENAYGSENVQAGPSQAAAHTKAEALDRSRRPRQGFLSLTAVEEGTAELAAAAVKQLRRLRMCPDGRDEMATHLIVGAQKRTLKVMLAIARGAWLLSPAWLTASLEAGRWQDEEDFPAQVPYSAAAAAARLHHEQKKPPLLKGVSIHILEPDVPTPQTASRAAALKRTALAHGAHVTGVKSCTLCVVMNGSTHARGSCQAVTEDWLLSMAESFTLPQREASFTLAS